MNHIGNVIKEVRCNLGMSRSELSENICSEKYLYLIEKGERTPSTEIVRLFSAKLDADIFEYYKYLGCIDPIKVCEAIKQFNTYRRIADFESLRKLSDSMAVLPDFQKMHWKYEIEVNRLSYMVFVDQKCNEAITLIKELLSQIEPKYSEEEYTANLYLLLSTCYQILNDIDGANQALSVAYQIVQNKQNIAAYNQIIISVKLNAMTLYHLSEEYDAAIEEGLLINRLQLESNSYERANFTFYYLAYAYYKKGLQDAAFEWFEKGLYDLLIHYSPIPAYYISNYDLFYQLLNDKRVSHELVTKIKNKYDFIK